MLPPGPPGLKRMVFHPLADVFVANIQMRGIENVFSDAELLKWSMGTSMRVPF
jgi:hypothetical protein